MIDAEFIFVGTFPKAHRSDPADAAFGVYVLRLDPVSGELGPVGMTPTPRPGWVTLHPSRRYLYAVNEVHEFEGRSGGGVSAFAIDQATGQLSPLNTRPVGSPLPCHCVVDGTGRYLLVSTYLEGTIELFPIEGDGRLGAVRDVHQHEGSSIDPRRQSQAHAHSINLDPANRFALAADLGTDRVVVYELDLERGKLIPHPEREARVTPGSGPRHLAFHPNAPFVYLINEMSATVTVFAYDAATGTPREIQTVPTLPDGFAGYRSTAEIAVHPSGRFLYGTNRSYGSSSTPPELGEDTIVWFEIDQGSGRLTPRGRVQTGGETPRSFVIDPSGARLYVANQRSNNLAAFRIDPGTGALSPAGHLTSTPVPVCLQIAAGEGDSPAVSWR
jgi:6-phosphogluconolactonase